jgi:hypothetical protein
MATTEEKETREGDSVALVRKETRTQIVEAGSAALSAQIEARIKGQFFLARQFPRDWREVRSKLLQAFERPMLAEGAIYSKPVGGKRVEGLSIRFAEEAFRAMGNVSVETMLVSDDEDKRVYIVSGMDMETNAIVPVTVVVTKQVERSSTKAGDVVLGERLNSNGNKTFILKARSEDDYRAKEQGALQRARRDVIIFLTPGDIQEECETKIRETLRDRDRKDPEGTINALTDSYYRLGVSVAEIEKFLGHSVKTINEAELHILRVTYTMIKEGEGTWAMAVEHKLGANTGADAGDDSAKPAKTGAAAKLAEVAKAGEAQTTEESRIDALRKKKTRTDEENEELRQYELDHPRAAAAE